MKRGEKKEEEILLYLKPKSKTGIRFIYIFVCIVVFVFFLFFLAFQREGPKLSICK